MVKAVTCTDEPAYLVTLDALGDEQVKFTSLSRLFDCVPQINEEYADCCDDEHQDVRRLSDFSRTGLKNQIVSANRLSFAERGISSVVFEPKLPNVVHVAL